MRWSEGLALPAETGAVLSAVHAAALPDQPVALVGGFVRDLLLGRETRDLDLVVEGSGAGLGRRVAEDLAVEARVHPAFDTAELRVGDLRIDMAGARSERYPAPAALPVIAPATMEEDLARRDFTVNAMALPLAAASSAEIIDLHRGREALAQRRLTVLHPASFRDDPTRILRGLELAVRLRFRFDLETVTLARAGATHLDGLSPARLLEAWTRTFPDPGRLTETMVALTGLDVSTALSPGVRLLGVADVERLEAVLTSPAGAGVAAGRALLAVLARRGGGAVERDLSRRFGLPRLDGVGERLARAEADLSAARPPHQLEAAIADLDATDLVALAATAPAPAAERAARALTAWRPLRLGIGGADLLAAGWPPGPRLGEVLARTRAARLDGEITPGQELAFALDWLARAGGHE